MTKPKLQGTEYVVDGKFVFVPAGTEIVELLEEPEDKIDGTIQPVHE